MSWSVRAIWDNYAGWFHARSTTELCGVPEASVHGDLAALAGVDAIARRAHERLAAGDTPEAIHLAEIALAGDPTHRNALEAMLAAHERLETESANFWERSWLQREIGRLRAALGEGA